MQFTNEQVKNLALDLLSAENEAEVIEILKQHNLWDDSRHWRLYGDKEGNFSQAGNQQSYPEAALAEKLVNSIDARLQKKCLEAEIHPESENAPVSIRDAVARFYEGRSSASDEAGTLANWSSSQRTDEARNITLAATGNVRGRGKKPINMCLTVTDQGEGQYPSRLPDTILSLNATNKQRIRFVQGKFNMGGSGALRFCGRNGIQLVISRRNRRLAELDPNPPSDRDLWGVTVVRREEPSSKSGEPVHSEFTYLAPVGAESKERHGEVLSFAASELNLAPKHDEAYAQPIEGGTCIKLYEYETSVGQSNILMKDGLLFALERLLPEIALPIRVHECRGYKGVKERSFETTLSGLTVRLEEGRGDSLEPSFPQSVQFRAANMDMRARLYAFKEDRASTYLKDEGVIFTVNGQAHGYLPKTIFSRPKAVGLPRLKDSLLVLIDCTKLSARQREDLFMTSRDRLSKNPIRYELEREIEQFLQRIPALRELQNARRHKDVEEKLSDEKPLEEVLGKVFKSSPTLRTLFTQGQRLTNPFGKTGGAKTGKKGGPNPGIKDFVGRKFPTYFTIEGITEGQVYSRNCEIGRRTRIEFITDAENDYFDRSTDRGQFNLEVVDGPDEVAIPNYNLHLEDGRAFLNIALPSGLEIGDSVTLQATVNDSTQTEPFINLVKLNAIPRYNRAGGKKKKACRREGEGKGQELGSGGIELPEVITVRKGDERWERYGFDERTATHVISEPIEVGDESSTKHTFYINVDNVSLQTEMKGSKQDPRLLEAKFKYGNVLFGLAVLHDRDRTNGKSGAESSAGGGIEADSDGSDIDPTEEVRRLTSAVAPVILPMIDQLSGLEENDLEEME